MAEFLSALSSIRKPWVRELSLLGTGPGGSQLSFGLDFWGSKFRLYYFSETRSCVSQAGFGFTLCLGMTLNS